MERNARNRLRNSSSQTRDYGCSSKPSRGTQYSPKYCSSVCETLPQRLWRWFGSGVWHIILFGLSSLLTLFVVVYIALMLENYKTRTGRPTCVCWPEWIESTIFSLSEWLLEKMGRPRRVPSASPIAT